MLKKYIYVVSILLSAIYFSFVCLGAGYVVGNWSGIFTGAAYINSGILTNVVAYGNGANLNNLQSTNTINTIVTTTSSYNLGPNDSTVILNALSLTATLPSPVGISGYQYTIINSFSGSQTINSLAGLIDGSSSYILSSQYNSVTVQSDGVNWWIINSH